MALLLTSAAFAQTSPAFPQKLNKVLQDHQLAKMVEADVATAEAQIDVERSGYFPRLNMSAGVGEQTIRREVGASGTYKPEEASLVVNQLVSDFGYTRSRVDAARVVFDKEILEKELQLQNLTLAAVEAQLQLVQAHRSLAFAKRSEENIKRQTDLENARMEAGRGYATDVLQAKSQLAGAEARRVMAESRMREAQNRYRTVFGDVPANPADLEVMSIIRGFAPETEQAIIDGINQQNPDLLAAIRRADVALAERDMARNKETRPRLYVRLSRSSYNDYDGSPGRRDDTKAMLMLDWQFEFGGKARHLTRSADQAVMSAQQKADYVRVQAIEEGSNAWSSWLGAQERAALLANQVSIAESFLALARRERDLGRRSLVEVLNGEVALINAQSDATAAKIDEIIAFYRLLRVTGRLTPALFERQGVLQPANEVLGGI
jgi:adhesin transport system outer membrane protein